MKMSVYHSKQADACDALAMDYPEHSALRVSFKMKAYRHRRVAIEFVGLEREEAKHSALIDADLAAKGMDERDYWTGQQMEKRP